MRQVWVAVQMMLHAHSTESGIHAGTYNLEKLVQLQSEGSAWCPGYMHPFGMSRFERCSLSLHSYSLSIVTLSSQIQTCMLLQLGLCDNFTFCMMLGLILCPISNVQTGLSISHAKFDSSNVKAAKFKAKCTLLCLECCFQSVKRK